MHHFMGQRADSVLALFRYSSICATIFGLAAATRAARRDRRKIVELERRVFFQANRLPRSHPHGLLEAALVKLPIEELVRRLRFAPKRARHREAVDG